jgi:hypothetical protein
MAKEHICVSCEVKSNANAAPIEFGIDKLQPLQSKPLGLAITTAAFLPNTSKAPFNTERLVEPTSFRIISAFCFKKPT